MQWYLWGYALAFTTGTPWFGGLGSLLALQTSPDAVFSTLGNPAPHQISEPVYILFQGMFASFT